jgi:hypothetical protein
LAYSNPLTWAAGARGEYQWLTSGQHDLAALLQMCPQVVLGKYIAVTSFDSGPLILNDDEVSAGWRARNDIAYSPKIQSVDKLTHGERAGWNEWYVFGAPMDLGQMFSGNVFEYPLQPGTVAAFVNYSGFSFHTPIMKDLADLFWKQLEWICPESYIADGDILNFASRDKRLFAGVLQSLSSESS